jgi:hypothetical protein
VRVLAISVSPDPPIEELLSTHYPPMFSVRRSEVRWCHALSRSGMRLW